MNDSYCYCLSIQHDMIREIRKETAITSDLRYLVTVNMSGAVNIDGL